MADFWITDIDTYNKLQELKKFVQFIAGLKFSTAANKQNADTIIHLIETINQPETFKCWNVCLDIYDADIQNGIHKQGGIYWRTWAVWFEINYLIIEAKTKHTQEPLHHYGKDFNFQAIIYFEKEISGDRIYMNNDLKSFVADAFKYEEYITETLNDVEIDIDLE